MKRFHYKDKKLDGDQKVFDQGFKCGYQKGYRVGRNHDLKKGYKNLLNDMQMETNL